MSCCGYVNLYVWLNGSVMDVADIEFDNFVKAIREIYI